MDNHGNPAAGGRNDPPPHPTPTNYDNGDPSTSSSPTCFKCNQPGHFATHCPNDPRGKALDVNMITVDVQQVTTRSKETQSPWETQDTVRQQATDWVKGANQRNIDQMTSDNTARLPPQPGVSSPRGSNDTTPSTPATTDDDWLTLADSQISLPLHKLLHLLPRFRDHIHSRTTQDAPQATVHLTSPTTAHTQLK